MIFYVKSETREATLFVEAGADGYDTRIGFRQDFTTIFNIGHDDSDDVFKIIAGSSLAGNGGIHVDTSNEVILPSLAGTGPRAVYANTSGLLTTVIAPARELKMVGFEIDHTTASSASHDMLLIPVGAYVEKIEVWVKELMFSLHYG